MGRRIPVTGRLDPGDRRARATWWIVAVTLALAAAVVFFVRLSGRDDVAATEPAPTAATRAEPTSGPVNASEVPPPTASALASGTAPIEAPAPGTTVRRCEVLRGTVSRPAGTVLYTAMRNLDNGDPAWYFQDLFTQPAAGSGGPWSGPQFFGSGDGSVGQRYEVLLVAIGYQVAVPDDTESIALGQLVEERNRLASATYERVKGVPAGECEAP